MAQDNLQEELLRAIDYLVNNRIDKIDRDKTIVAKVLACQNALTGEYKVSYNGGYMLAYAQDEASYELNTNVYILVPGGDFTQKKIILGKGQYNTEDANTTVVSSLMNDYNPIGRNPITMRQKRVGLHSYLKDDYQLLYSRSADDTQNLLDFNADEFANYIQGAESLLVEGTFQTRLPRAHQLSRTGVYGLQFVLAFSDKDNPDAVKYVSYTIDSDSMTGNPLLYGAATDQYAIFSIDTENFLYVDSIMAYSTGFEDKDDTAQAYTLWGEDIYVSEPEIYGLKKIQATNGDYTLRLTTPLGSTFKTVSSTEVLSAQGRTTYKINSDISDQTTYYWFSKDDRISTSSTEYLMYGGSGWKYLKDAGNNKTFTTTGADNRAYENQYMVAAVYKQEVILKDYFSFYNEAAKRDIEVTSDLGVKFSFDRGTPTLTCLVNGREASFEDSHADSLFSFAWSVRESGKSAVSLARTYEQLKDEYEQALIDGAGYSKLASLKAQMALMDGVTFDKNRLTYPVRNIQSAATFSCSVYLRENEAAEDYFIGSASITLNNADAATPNDYYILIENGNQIFQYTESGVSPASQRVKDPLEVLPLSCHFYDPAGLEVNAETYTVTWVVPLEDTMVVAPTANMKLNPSSGEIDTYHGEVYPLSIGESFDYQALDNQVTCVVEYQGQEYRQDSDLTFTKVGENGTNGTDVVAKISPINPPKDRLLALEKRDGITSWNNGYQLASPALKFEAYQRNKVMPLTQVLWTMSGGASKSKWLGVEADSDTQAIVTYDEDKQGSNYNQIVRGSTTYESQTYYAFYGVPVISYTTLAPYSVKLDKTRTLKSVTYNADGRNPLYDKNQGIFFSLGSDVSEKYIEWTAQGGIDDDQSTAAFGLITSKNAESPVTQVYTRGSATSVVDEYAAKQSELKKSKEDTLSSMYDELQKTLADILAADISQEEKDAKSKAAQTKYDSDVVNYNQEYERQLETVKSKYEKLISELEKSDIEYHIYIKPNDVYDGAWSNNLVHIRIFDRDHTQFPQDNPECEMWIPIYMSLNTFGLSSLNAWDGNHVEINEEEDYILAPQIGAGVKDANNRFTGLVMGKSQTYDASDVSVGLLGYSKGKQSIWLDADTGKAVFGLPEQQASASNRFTEGRIELVPGGDSKIGMWTIGSRAIYNMTKPAIIGDDPEGDPIYQGVQPGKPYKDYPVANAQISTPVDSQGIILNADPAYISVKGIPLDETNSNIDWDNVNNILTKGDSLEVELDPHKSSVFSIYRHTQQYGSWERYPLVGIDSMGRFYTNAVKDGESSMGIGVVGAFGEAASEQKYIGASFSYGSSNVLKFFIDNPTKNEGVTQDSATMYFTTGSSLTDEYPRPIQMNGKSLALYASNPKSVEKTTDDRFVLTSSMIELGHANTYLKMPNASDGNTELITDANLVINSAPNRAATLIFGTTSLDTGAFNAVINSGGATNSTGFSAQVTGRAEVTGASAIKLAATGNMNRNWTLNMDDVVKLGKDNVYIQENPSTISMLYSAFGWNIEGNGGPINIYSKNSAEGVNIDAYFGNSSAARPYLHLVPASDGSGDFYLSSGHGTVKSVANVGDGDSGVQITPGLTTKWQYVTGNLHVGDLLDAQGKIKCGGDIECGDHVAYLGGVKIGNKGVLYQSWFDAIQDMYDHRISRSEVENIERTLKNSISSLKSWVRNNFTTKDTFNKHYHELDFSQSGTQLTATENGGTPSHQHGFRRSIRTQSPR